MVGNVKPPNRPKPKPRKKPLPGALSTTFLANCHQPARRLTSDGEGSSDRSVASMSTAASPCDQPSQIRPWLYLGSYSNAMDRTLLNDYGVTMILNTALECDSSEREEEIRLLENPNFDVLNVGIRDHADENLSCIFSSSFRFIDQAKRDGKKVLVHCRRGISRSAAVVIAYLIQSEQLSLDTAFEEVRKERSIICPNLGFVLELEQWVHNINRAAAEVSMVARVSVSPVLAPPSPVSCQPDYRHAIHA
eukprot:TRINITY_DN1004_c0_g2_i3.p1 TRINITY_DN1004_c0_g2~~TRINITY_DN1004_c0_g2_i3.p1  ORF type:complete len:249 (+),score=74.70 TRINITY_DN1004_c0_g2_i3:386-1132(+)